MFLPVRVWPKNLRFVRSEKWQNESSPSFSNFRPEFCPEFCSEFSPNFFEEFSGLRFMGNGDQKKFTMKIPAIFQWKIPTQIRKINSQNVSGERAKQRFVLVAFFAGSGWEEPSMDWSIQIFPESKAPINWSMRVSLKFIWTNGSQISLKVLVCTGIGP